jgi:hypothetical protein
MHAAILSASRMPDKYAPWVVAECCADVASPAKNILFAIGSAIVW